MYKSSACFIKYKLGKLTKLTFAFLIYFCLQADANGIKEKINIDKKNVSLADVFKDIERQTEFVFFYDKFDLQKTSPMDIYLKDATLEQAMKACLKDQDLIYSVIKNTVVIYSTRKTKNFLHAFYNYSVPLMVP